MIKYATDFPAYGQARTSNELRKLGVFVSPSGVRSIWLCHDLANFKTRLKALEVKVAEEGGILTEAQVQALEKKKLDDEACGEIETAHPERHPPKMIVLDMDSSVSPTHGDQEGSAYNGHFGCSCYHPLFVFNQFGDLERSSLRPGNVHSADGWPDVLEPVIERYRKRDLRRYFRGDAAFVVGRRRH